MLGSLPAELRPGDVKCMDLRIFYSAMGVVSDEHLAAEMEN